MGVSLSLSLLLLLLPGAIGACAKREANSEFSGEFLAFVACKCLPIIVIKQLDVVFDKRQRSEALWLINCRR